MVLCAGPTLLSEATLARHIASEGPACPTAAIVEPWAVLRPGVNFVDERRVTSIGTFNMPICCVKIGATPYI